MRRLKNSGGLRPPTEAAEHVRGGHRPPLQLVHRQIQTLPGRPRRRGNSALQSKVRSSTAFGITYSAAAADRPGGTIGNPRTVTLPVFFAEETHAPERSEGSHSQLTCVLLHETLRCAQDDTLSEKQSFEPKDGSRINQPLQILDADLADAGRRELQDRVFASDRLANAQRSALALLASVSLP